MTTGTTGTPLRVVIADAVEQSAVTTLQADGFRVDALAGKPAAELQAALAEADGLIVRSATKVTADFLQKAPRLQIIGRAGTGVDNIDVTAATRRGIVVMNTPGGNTISTAEHAVSMLLSLARNIPQATASMRSGKWEKKKYTGTEVTGKTAGVIGLGKIGREVAERLKGLAMNVIGADPVLAPDVAQRLGIELVTLEELYRRSDFITVHTPLSAETKGLLNRETIGRCKRGVRIINCARGGIVDEAALLEALNAGHVEGAALDVFTVEPPADNPLVQHDHVIVTPHLAASTEEAQEKVAVQIARQMADAFRGRGYAGVVNSAAVQTGVSDDVRPFLLLAERMGSFVGQVLGGAKVEGLSFAVSGVRAQGAFELLRAGVLQGLLNRLVPEPVNLVSAPFLAQEMGLAVSETREQGSDENVLRIRYTAGGVEREVAGTVFGASAIRFIRLDKFRFEVRPEGRLLLYRNADKPGILARVGGILAAHGVNIADVALGRTGPGGEALTVMNLDSEPPAAALKELRAVDAVSDLRSVLLP